MQISLNWMNEFVDLTDKTVEEIAHNLTMSGLEVEEIEHLQPKFTNITTAKIIAMEKHPDADKLRLVTVETAFGTKTVVCGAQNIEVGQVIPYATIGSKVFHTPFVDNFACGEKFDLKTAISTCFYVKIGRFKIFYEVLYMWKTLLKTLWQRTEVGK